MSPIDLPAIVWRIALRSTIGMRLRRRAWRGQRLIPVDAILELRAQTTEGLQSEQFKAAADTWGLSPVVIHALADVAKVGAGFGPDGRATILVEPHLFSRATFHAFDETYPDVSYPVRVRYRPGDPPPAGFGYHPYAMDHYQRWALFTAMAELHLEGALAALKVGRFHQPIAEADSLRYPSRSILMHKLAISEADQLEVLIRTALAHGLRPALEAGDWRAVAQGYDRLGPAHSAAEALGAAFHKRSRLYA